MHLWCVIIKFFIILVIKTALLKSDVPGHFKISEHSQSVKTEKFKFELDKFLDTIPDQPKMHNYVTTSGSNSILNQHTHRRAQGIYHNGGVPDLPWSSLSCFEATPRIQVSIQVKPTPPSFQPTGIGLGSLWKGNRCVCPISF